MHKTMYKKRIR